jgi:hypothetical protein
LALPKEANQLSLPTLRQRLVKIGAKIVHNGRSIVIQFAVPRDLFKQILGAIARLGRCRLCAAEDPGRARLKHVPEGGTRPSGGLPVKTYFRSTHPPSRRGC